MPFPITSTTVAALDKALQELSNNTIGVETDEHPVSGLASWAHVTFNCEHEQVIVLGVTDAGQQVGFVGYGTSSEVALATKNWESILSADIIADLASDSCDERNVGVQTAIALVQSLPKFLLGN